VLSIIITNYYPDLKEYPLCWESLKGKGHEVIVISSKSSLSQKINAGARAASGDYFMFVNDDATYGSGNLDDMCVPDKITCPTYNRDDFKPRFHVFCVSREVFEKVGGYDEHYKNALYDDNDFVFKCRNIGVDFVNVPSVDFGHPQGGTTIGKIGGSFGKENQDYFFNKWGRLP
jgi:GT2 family glycosyltransferase